MMIDALPPELEAQIVELLATLNGLRGRSEQDRRFGPARCRNACVAAIHATVTAAMRWGYQRALTELKG